MSDIERAASMVGCWYGDAERSEIGDLLFVQSHDGAGRVRVLCLWECGGEDTLTLRASLLAPAVRRVA